MQGQQQPGRAHIIKKISSCLFQTAPPVSPGRSALSGPSAGGAGAAPSTLMPLIAFAEARRRQSGGPGRGRLFISKSLVGPCGQVRKHFPCYEISIKLGLALTVSMPPCPISDIWPESMGWHNNKILEYLSMCLASTPDSAFQSCSVAGRTMLVVQPGAGLGADEELRSICAWACICHAEQSWSIMAEPEIFILKGLSVDGLASRPVSLCEVPALAHELGDDPASKALLHWKAAMHMKTPHHQA